jgi:hypothetical protein
MGLDRDFVALERLTTFQRFAATAGVGGRLITFFAA